MTDETKKCSECGETILAVAKRCKHCQADLTGARVQAVPAVSGSGFDIGAAMLAIPVVGTLLAWFWIGNMNLLQSPGDSLALVVVAVICGTAILAVVEASKVGAVSDKKSGTYSPVQWFFIIALLWIVGYPAYLLKRRNYGLKNYLWAGVAVMVVFLASALTIQSSINDSVNEIRALFGLKHDESPSLLSEVMGLFVKSPEQKAKEAAADAAIEKQVVHLLNRVVAVQDGVTDYFVTNGVMPTSCSEVGGCLPLASVSVGGRITVKLDGSISSEVTGKSIVLAPAVSKGGDVTWHCASDLDPRFSPSECRGPIQSLPAAYVPEPEPAVVAAQPVPLAPMVAQVTPEAANSSLAVGVAPEPTEAPPEMPAKPSGQAPIQSNVVSSQAAPSFDCVKAASSIERQICGSPKLAAADSELAAFYRKNLNAAGTSRDQIVQDQRAFVAKRNKCTSEYCIAEAYRARYEELAIMGFVRE